MLGYTNEGVRIIVRFTTIPNGLNLEMKKKNYSKMLYIAVTSVYL
jgi:hypothetical protein